MSNNQQQHPPYNKKEIDGQETIPIRTEEKKYLFHKKKCTECKKQKKEMEEYRNGWQRAQADYQNLKKEIELKKSEWARISEWQVLKEFLPLYDHFKKATEHTPKEENKVWQNWAQGVGFIMKQFGDILKQHRIEEIKTVGEIFDPMRHECLSEEASEETDGVVIKELETGYEMDGKVLKVAKVIISQGEKK